MSNLQRYRIKRKISAGGMATVYLAEDKALGREVALKMIHSHLLSRHEAVARFCNEAKAIASLSHENIIKVFDFSDSAERPFLVMEYIDGPTISELIEKHKKLPNLFMIEVAKQILAGLASAHNNGIYHRDIKPANIIIERNGILRIMDFGIAYVVNNESLTLTGAFVGSPHYISPEQAEGKPLSNKTDIFSLGILLYQGLTGALPFEAETPHAIINAIVSASPPPIFSRNQAVLPWFVDLINACLSKDASDRPNASEILAQIDKNSALDGISIDRMRIEEFIATPKIAIAREQTEIFSVYRKKAHDEFKAKKHGSALRCLELVKEFGALDSEDVKLEKAICRSQQLRKASNLVYYSLLTLICAMIVVYTVYIYKQKGKNQELTTTALPEVITVKQQPDTDRIHDTLISKQEPKDKNPVDTILLKKDNAQDNIRQKYRNTVKSNSESQNGFLNIKTNPPWVNITIDGIDRGVTPKVSLIQVAPGVHQLLLQKSSYADYKEVFSIKSGDTLTLRLKLDSLFDSAGVQ